jgi:hypothetical protein
MLNFASLPLACERLARLLLVVPWLGLVSPLPVSAEPEQDEPVPHPADLVVLEDRVGRGGRELIGVFGTEVDASEAGVRRIRIWEEKRDRVTVSTDVVRCSPTGPMRITGREGSLGRRLILRELNPGGAITRENRLDHLIWWAACQPEQAGKDPASLAPLARQLGYSGTLVEREQVLPAPRR